MRIRSTLGRGTMVRLCLPLEQPLAGKADLADVAA